MNIVYLGASFPKGHSIKPFEEEHPHEHMHMHE